jgi:hypothetical protein
MKRYLAGVAVAGCLFAVAAGTAAAAAKANYDIASQSGFISRGDVIAAGGKDALVANPIVRFLLETRTRLTCTWPDSSQASTTTETTLLILYRAETRTAPGNGTITGYSFSRNDVVDSEIFPPFDDPTATCWALRGVADDGTPVQVDVTPLGTTSELTFFGPSGAFDVGF